MLQAQGGVCVICGKPESVVRNGTVQRLAVDHDHESGKVRGLLCYGCNIMLGGAKDNAGVLISGAAYLRKHS